MIKLKSLFRRGQGPSGSKHSANGGNAAAPSTQNQLKGSSSVSSLDNIDQIKTTKSSSKSHHGSKDRLIDHKIKGGSRDKLAASRESLDIKESKRHRTTDQQRHNQMPLIQQHVGNNNLIDQRDVTNYSVDTLTKELTDISFDGPREVSEFIFLFFTYFSILQLTHSSTNIIIIYSIEVDNCLTKTHKITQHSN